MFLRASTKLLWPSVGHKPKNTNLTLVWTIDYEYLAKQRHRWGRGCVEESRLCSCAMLPAGLLPFSSQHNTSLAYTCKLRTPFLLLSYSYNWALLPNNRISSLTFLMEIFVTHWRNHLKNKLRNPNRQVGSQHGSVRKFIWTSTPTILHTNKHPFDLTSPNIVRLRPFERILKKLKWTKKDWNIQLSNIPSLIQNQHEFEWISASVF